MPTRELRHEARLTGKPLQDTLDDESSACCCKFHLEAKSHRRKSHVDLTQRWRQATWRPLDCGKLGVVSACALRKPNVQRFDGSSATKLGTLPLLRMLDKVTRPKSTGTSPRPSALEAPCRLSLLADEPESVPPVLLLPTTSKRHCAAPRPNDVLQCSRCEGEE